MQIKYGVMESGSITALYNQLKGWEKSILPRSQCRADYYAFLYNDDTVPTLIYIEIFKGNDLLAVAYVGDCFSSDEIKVKKFSFPVTLTGEFAVKYPNPIQVFYASGEKYSRYTITQTKMETMYDNLRSFSLNYKRGEIPVNYYCFLDKHEKVHMIRMVCGEEKNPAWAKDFVAENGSLFSVKEIEDDCMNFAYREACIEVLSRIYSEDLNEMNRLAKKYSSAD